MPAAILDSLSEAARELGSVLPPLESAVAGLRSAPCKGVGSRAAPGSKPPWNAQVAIVLTDIHYGVRDLEATLRYVTSGVLRERGGSDANTLVAISVIVSLAAGADYPAQRSAVSRLQSWAWRGRVALGESEPPLQVYREVGKSVARCPWCNFTSLRMRPVAGLVFCINPSCKDDESRKPIAKVELGSVYGESLLIWQDGSVGLA